MNAISSNPGPAYRIQTERLVLRCWNPTDAALLKQAVDQSREHLEPWMIWARSEPEDLHVVVQRMRKWRAAFDLGEDFVYGIFDRNEQQVLGGTGLHTRQGKGAREIGYWIHADHIGQGLATETAAALTRVAFEVDGVNRVEIHCDPKNERSAAIPRKLGFELEAVLKQRQALEDRWRDDMIWTLFKDNYPTSPAAKAILIAYDVTGRQIL